MFSPVRRALVKQVRATFNDQSKGEKPIPASDDALFAPGAVLVPDAYDAAQRESLARTTPLGRLGTPSDVVEAVIYLVEHGDYVTGQTLVVDGGRRIR